MTYEPTLADTSERMTVSEGANSHCFDLRLMIGERIVGFADDPEATKIAEAYNSVVSGDLVPPATSDNAVATPMPQDVAALIVELRADAELHEDLLPDRAADVIVAQAATIARLTDAYMIASENRTMWKRRAEQAEAKLAGAGTFAQGIEACREALGTLLVQANGVEPQDAKLRQNVVRIASAALALSNTPQAVDVRDTPPQAQQAGLSDAGAPQADPVREAGGE